MDEGDEAPNRRRSHCGGGRRSVVRTKQQLLLAFAKVALGVDRMALLLFVAIGLGEDGFAWCAPSSSSSSPLPSSPPPSAPPLTH